jgi:hypothetical protein
VEVVEQSKLGVVAEAVAVGAALLTVTFTVLITEQPFVLETVTEYNVVAVGETAAVVAEVPNVLFQRYVDPPLAVNVVVGVLQFIVGVVADAVALVGAALSTVTVTDFVTVHPFVPVIVTVYVFVVAGETGTVVAEVPKPSLHK